MTSFSPSQSKNVNSQMTSHRESDGDEQELLDFRISEDVENNAMAYMFEPRAARCRLDRASSLYSLYRDGRHSCKFLACPNKSSNHYKKPSPVHISGLNIVKHT